jgi:hypothetical protein
MTADDATPALSPLRQQIAEAIHDARLTWRGGGDDSYDLLMADAVVALLNLTEADLAGIIMWYFGTTGDGEDPAWAAAWAAAHSFLNDEDETPVPGSPGPWRLPSTPPDTSSSEPA